MCLIHKIPCAFTVTELVSSMNAGLPCRTTLYYFDKIDNAANNWRSWLVLQF